MPFEVFLLFLIEKRKGLKYCNRKSNHITDVTKAVAVEDAERRAEIKEYADHKESFAKNIQFDGKRANKSKLINIKGASIFVSCRKSHSLHQPVLSYLCGQCYL